MIGTDSCLTCGEGRCSDVQHTHVAETSRKESIDQSRRSSSYVNDAGVHGDAEYVDEFEGHRRLILKPTERLVVSTLVNGVPVSLSITWHRESSLLRATVLEQPATTSSDHASLLD